MRKELWPPAFGTWSAEERLLSIQRDLYRLCEYYRAGDFIPEPEELLYSRPLPYLVENALRVGIREKEFLVSYLGDDTAWSDKLLGAVLGCDDGE